MTLTISVPWVLLGLSLVAFVWPFIAVRDDYASFAGGVAFMLWVSACWPVGLVLLIFAVVEFIR